MRNEPFSNLIFFPKDSYLGVLRLFLRVLEVARSRRLGIVGEVSVWPDPVLHKNQPVSVVFRFWISVLRKNLGGRFSYCKNDHYLLVSTQRLPMHWSLRDSLRDDIAFFSPDASKTSSSFSCRFFLNWNR